jgi:hypothetical protein
MQHHVTMSVVIYLKTLLLIRLDHLTPCLLVHEALWIWLPSLCPLCSICSCFEFVVLCFCHVQLNGHLSKDTIVPTHCAVMYCILHKVCEGA